MIPWRRLNPMEWLKLLYGAVGERHPLASLILVTMMGALLFCGAWMLIGTQWRKDHPLIPMTEKPQGESETRLIVQLFPGQAENKPFFAPTSALISLQNISKSEMDRDIYIRMRTPPIANVVLDSVEKMRLISTERVHTFGGANLEISVPELFPQETRTATVYLLPGSKGDWMANLWSQRYHNNGNIRIFSLRIKIEPNVEKK